MASIGSAAAASMPDWSTTVASVEDVTWVADDGIRYLLPQIVLVYKARLRRPKDEPDFEAALPILTEPQRAWMRQALASVVPDHHWLDRL